MAKLITRARPTVVKTTSTPTPEPNSQQYVSKEAFDKLVKSIDTFFEHPIFGTGSETTTNSILIGHNLKSKKVEKLALGKFNKDQHDTLFELGTGTSDSNRRNSLEVNKGGVLLAPQNTKLRKSLDSQIITQMSLLDFFNEYKANIAKDLLKHIDDIESKLSELYKTLANTPKLISEVKSKETQIIDEVNLLKSKVEGLSQLYTKFQNDIVKLSEELKKSEKISEPISIKFKMNSPSVLICELPYRFSKVTVTVQQDLFSPLQELEFKVLQYHSRIFVEKVSNIGIELVSDLYFPDNSNDLHLALNIAENTDTSEFYGAYVLIESLL